jgi:hypothetical protein
MASVQTSSYDGRYLKLTVYEESYSIANNTSTVRWTLESIGGSVNYYTIYNWGVWVNGQQIYGTQTTYWNSYNFPAKTGSATGTITVNHNADGSAGNVGFQLNGCVYYNKSNSYTGSISLTKIPRQANLTSAPDFNDEANPTIGYSNPAGNSVSSLDACISLTGSRDDIGYRAVSKTGSSYTFNLTEAERNVLRGACPNSNSLSVKFYLRTVISGNTYYSILTKTMTIVNGNPTFSDSNITYKDSNSTTVAVTGNNQKLVQNLSNLLATITSATAKKSASISKYEATINGVTKTITSAGNIDFGVINSANNLTLSVKVTDSRGNTVTVSKNVTFLAWVLPTAIISLKRKNNYEDQSYLTVNATYSSVDSKNSVTIKYQYKKTTESSYTALKTINNGSQENITLSKDYAWDFKIVITDKFGTTTYNTILAKGKFILFVDTKKLSVGVNCFPTKTESLEVNGVQVLEYDEIASW